MTTTKDGNIGKRDGSSIYLIEFLDGTIMRANDSFSLVLHYEYHGEYDDAWILEIHNGQEFARHNVKGIGTITWMQT